MLGVLEWREALDGTDMMPSAGQVDLRLESEFSERAVNLGESAGPEITRGYVMETSDGAVLPELSQASYMIHTRVVSRYSGERTSKNWLTRGV